MNWNQMNGETPMLLLGRLLERSDQTLEWLRRIDHRLSEGDRRFEANELRLALLEAHRRMSRPESSGSRLAALTALISAARDFAVSVAPLWQWLTGTALFAWAIDTIADPARMLAVIAAAKAALSN